MKTVRLDNPCEECLLPKCAVSTKGKKTARFLVVCKGATKRQSQKNMNISIEGMRMFSSNMQKAGFHKDDFVFTNAIKCGYDATEWVAKDKHLIQRSCREYLLRLIEKMNPEVIIPLGADAASAVMGRAVKISKARGVAEYSREFDAHVLPMVDPWYATQYPQNEPIFASDCRTLERIVAFDYNIDEAEKAVLGDYRVVDDLQYLVDDPPEVLSFDLETLGLHPHDPNCQIMTMQFCTEEGKAQLLSWDHPDKPMPRRRRDRIVHQLKRILEHPDTSVVGQNLKYDALWMLNRFGIRIRIDDDTLMLAALVDENAMSKDLDTLTKLYVPAMAGYADSFNQKHNKDRMDLVPLEEIVDYGCGDVDAVFRLLQELLDIVEADEALYRHYRRVAMPALNAFLPIDNRGMMIDEDALDAFEEVLIEYVEGLRNRLMEQVPRAIKRKHAKRKNGLKFSSPKFVHDILFYHPSGYQLTPIVFTKTTMNLADNLKVPSLSSKDHLPYFFEDCPFTVDLAEWKKVDRLLGTNVQRFRENYIIDGKIHPIYNLWTAVTGRTSCLKGDVLVDTRKGKVRADAIAVGDEVFTHLGRWREVSKLFKKPITDMYDVTFDNGEVLTCTAYHIVLLNSGEWATIRSIIEGGIDYAHRLEKAHEQRKVGRTGCGRLPDNYDDGAGSSGQEQSQPHNSQSDDTDTYIRQGLQEIRALPISRVQTGREEPSVWEQMGIRLRGWEGVPDEVGRRGTVFCPPGSNGEQHGATPQTAHGRHGSSPHRREPEEQQHRQSSPLHEAGACGDTREIQLPFREVSIKRIDYSGSHRVYDFQVEEDHSYLACGAFSHNSKDPNGQNFPKRGQYAKAYRKIFIPPPGYVILEADLSQAELRIVADMANDPVMLRIYREHGDIHKTTALIVMGISLEEFESLTREEQALARFKAKAVNFGFIYGMGWRKFIVYAKTQYGVEFNEREARRIRIGFFNQFPAIQPWHETMRAFAAENAYVRSYDGRIRHLPMINSPEERIRGEASRQAINSPVQNFASDLGIMSMARIDQEIDPEYLAVTGFVHDALYALVREEHVEWGAKILKHYMESNPLEEWFDRTMKLPIIADVGFGWNGGETHEMGGLSLTEHYDFTTINRDEEGEIVFTLPRQVTPPNNGSIVQSEHLHIYL